MIAKNEAGNLYGRWTVLNRSDVNSPSGSAQWVCECECGVVKTVRGTHLRSGKTKSCGCLNLEERVEARTSHGLSSTHLYKKWSCMKERCYRPSNNRYSQYGGRGIEVCEEWKNDAEVFISWCKENGYEKELQIDRIDNDGNYSPENCRFVTPQENSENKTTSRYLEYNRETLSVSAFIKKYVGHCNPKTVRSRIYAGWPLDKIVRTPSIRAIAWTESA